jgi:hypothetical protein
VKFSNQSCLLHAGFLVGLLFDPEGGGDMLHRNFSLFFRVTIYISGTTMQHGDTYLKLLAKNNHLALRCLYFISINSH